MLFQFVKNKIIIFIYEEIAIIIKLNDCLIVKKIMKNLINN